MQAVVYNAATGEVRTLPTLDATELTRSDRRWSLTPPRPDGWDLEIPRYRASQRVIPAPLDRVRDDPPWANCSNTEIWQYGTAPIAAGEEVETTEWPHETFVPLNHSARAIHEFFTMVTKSRLQRSPWRDGRISLHDGLSGQLFAGPARRDAAASA